MMLKNYVFLFQAASYAVLVGMMAGWLLTPGAAFAQTAAGGSPQQAVMKIEESTHKLTPENQATKQVIVSKVYDTQDPLGNSYLLRVHGSDKAVVIDPGYNYEAIVKYLGQLHVDVEAILLTNGGFLRIAGNEELLKKWPKATILVGDKDAGLLIDPDANMSSAFGGVKSPIANVWLMDGDAFEIAGLPISVVGTPGFTSGSLTYVLATDDTAIAFTGDFIYKEGISSATMPSSSEDELHKSLDHFLETQFAETLVFPGHGENTSVTEFYQEMTGRSVSVVSDATSGGDSSPIIIVERDPATVVVTQPVYVPTVEYRTETIVVDRYVRPWVSIGVGIPVRSSWYRPWYEYYSYRPMPVPSIYLYRPFYGPIPYIGLYYGGYYPPPLIVPPHPGGPVKPFGYTPPRRGPGHFGPGPNHAGSGPSLLGVAPTQPGSDSSRPGVRPGRPGLGPEIFPPRPERPGPNAPAIQSLPGTLNASPAPETQQGPRVRPAPGTLSASPTPNVQSGPRVPPAPGTLSASPTPNVQSGPRVRPAPGTLNASPTPNVQSGPRVPPAPGTLSASPTPNAQQGLRARPAPGTLNASPTPNVQSGPRVRPAPGVQNMSPAPNTQQGPRVRPVPGTQNLSPTP
ncbi:MAG: MBL fold metallo-hydrolase, partial [Planctomycetaceae bacterium]|nr:MBL fold metallo-hydrolase [Planctomycetaceae bacterium]